MSVRPVVSSVARDGLDLDAAEQRYTSAHSMLDTLDTGQPYTTEVGVGLTAALDDNEALVAEVRRLRGEQVEILRDAAACAQVVADAVTERGRTEGDLAVAVVEVRRLRAQVQAVVRTLSNTDGYFLRDDHFDGLVGELFRALVDAGCDLNEFAAAGSGETGR